MAVYKTKEYRAWVEMKRRCYNSNRPNYKLYGARGITVCDRWRNSFSLFLTDMGFAPSKLHTLDRIDTNGHYEPSNVRWATAQEQSNNTRRNCMATVGDVTKSTADWSRETGIRSATIRHRLRKGMSAEGAVSIATKGWRRPIEFMGEVHTVREWSIILNVPVSTINYRLRNNIPINKEK